MSINATVRKPTTAEIRCVIEYDVVTSTYINAGWSCAVVIECGPVETFLEISMEGNEPADWTVSDSQTTYRQVNVTRDSAGPLVTICTMPECERILRLSELPDVLQVVRPAWRDAKASESLRMAQEAIEMGEADQR